MPDIGDRGVGYLDEEGQSGEWLESFGGLSRAEFGDRGVGMDKLFGL